MSIYTAVVGVVALVLASVTVLLGLGKADTQLIAMLIGFAGTQITVLVGVHQIVGTRRDLKNGAVKEPVKEAIREALNEGHNNDEL